MPALAVWTPEDGLLGALAPLGLAAAASGSALVVDLDEGGPHYPGEASLADLVRAGSRRADLYPERRGVAVLRNGNSNRSIALRADARGRLRGDGETASGRRGSSRPTATVARPAWRSVGSETAGSRCGSAFAG